MDRRNFLKGSTALSALALLPESLVARPPAIPDPPANVEYPNVAYADVNLNINGKSVGARVDTRQTLLDFLREDQQLNGTRKGCNHGACGACTVHINGQSTNACLQLVALCNGSEVTTIEGLANGEELHPMQEAFINHDAMQCGYCTSGQIMSAVAVVQNGHAKTRPEIRELMSGNLCRCGAYNGIVDAVEEQIKKTA